MGAKVFGMSRDKRVGYTIALMDQQSGGFAGLLDAYYVTSFRTGATSAVAVDRLATPGAEDRRGARQRLGGEFAHAARSRKSGRSRRCACSARPRQNREAFAARMQNEHGIPSVAVASAEAGGERAPTSWSPARARATRRRSSTAQWLKPGTVVVSIGSTLAGAARDRRQRGRRLRPDRLRHAGGSHRRDRRHDRGQKAAGIAFDHKIASLNDLMLGKLADQVKAARIPMFKSIGAGIAGYRDRRACVRARGRARACEPTLPIEFQIRRTGK